MQRPDYERLDELNAKASKGKLRAFGYRISHEGNKQPHLSVYHLDEIGQKGTGQYQMVEFARREDAEWHAEAHNAYPLIRSDVRRLEEALRQIKKSVLSDEFDSCPYCYEEDSEHTKECPVTIAREAIGHE